MGHGTPRQIYRRYTHRQVHAYLDAENRRQYDARQERWNLTRLTVSAWTGQTPDEYPAYPGDEDEDAAQIEAALDASPYVRRAPPPQQ